MTVKIGLRVKTFVYHIKKGNGPIQAIIETRKDFNALKEAQNSLTQGEAIINGTASSAEELFTTTIVENMENKVDEFKKRVEG